MYNAFLYIHVHVYLAIDRVDTAVHVQFTYLVKVCMTSMLVAMPQDHDYIAVFLEFNISDAWTLSTCPQDDCHIVCATS